MKACNNQQLDVVCGECGWVGEGLGVEWESGSGNEVV